MEKKYNVVILEDDDSDAELIDLHLKKSELEIATKMISTQAELVEILENETIDLFVSDYNLVGFTGKNALLMVKEKSPDIPFILVSGYLDVKEAVEIMKMGASDFIMKDELDRLTPAVSRELKIYDQKKAEKNLSEASYKLANIGHWRLDVTSNELHWSDEVKKIHEVDEEYEPTIEKAISFYKMGEHRKKIGQAVDSAIQTGKEYVLEAVLTTEKGKERWVRTNGKAEIINGSPIQIYGSIQDITEQKKVELALLESENKLRDIVEHSTNMFYRHDTEHKFNYLSPQSEHFLGLSSEDQVLKWTDFLTDHPINKIGTKYTERAIETGQIQPSYKLELKRRDGKKIWVRVNEAPVVEHGKTVAIVGSLTDITELVETERKEEVLAKVAAETENLVIITDANQNIEWVNKAFVDRTGYSLEEVIGKNPRFLQGHDTSSSTKKFIRQKLKTNESISTDILNYTKQGKPYWVRLNISPMRNEFGEVIRFFSIQEDITERKKFLERLKSKRERLEESQRLGNIGDWEYDLKTGEVTWSDMLFEIYERDPSQGPPGYERNIEYYFEEKELFKERVRLAAEEGVGYSYDIKIRTEKGTIKYVHLEGIPTVDDNGNVTRLHGIVQDITDIKKAKNDLLDERDRLIEAQKIGKIGDWEYDYESGKAYWSDQLYNIFDRKPAKGPLTKEELFSTFKDDVESIRKIIDQGLKMRKDYEFDVRIQTEAGNEKYIYLEAHPETDSSGSVTILKGVVQDITERKITELQLEQKNKQIEGISNNIQGLFLRYVLKPNGEDQLEYISSGVEMIYGISHESALTNVNTLWAQTIDEHIPRMRKSILDSANNLTPWKEEWQIESKNGTTKWLKALGIPEKRNNGETVWDTFIQDVTDWFEAERELHETMKLSDTIIDTMPGHLFMVEEDQTVTKWNRSAKKFYEHLSIPIEGKYIYELFNDSEKEKIQSFIQNLGDQTNDNIEVDLSVNSNKSTFFLTGNRLVFENRSLVILIAVNITDRKAVEIRNEALLKEVHHRVKNNLAIIIALLELQMEELDEDKRERLPLERAINRIYSIAEVHKLLHEDSNLTGIVAKNYFQSLVENTKKILEMEQDVEFNLVMDGLTLNVNELTPLGMLVNELFTNSIKYGCSGTKKCKISLIIEKQEKTYIVRYSDNGPGFKIEELQKSTTSGMRIINLLLQQLEADYKINMENGFGITFHFKEKLRGAHGHSLN